MKKITFLFAVIASIFMTDNAMAQYRNVSSGLNSVLENKIEKAVSVLAADGYKLSNYYVDELSKGESYIGSKTFHGGNEYAIIAVSEYGIDDLDLEIKRGATTIVEDDDTGDNGVAIVEFSNSYRRDLTIKVKNYDSYSKYRDYDVVILVAYKN